MKKLFIVLVALATSLGTSFASDSYKLDDSSMDAMFNAATEMAPSVLSTDITAALPDAMSTRMQISGDVDSKVLIAWIVDWVGLGLFGVHRYILGTKENMWAIYTFTACGIFGIVPFIDWWVLLIDGLILEHGDRYIDNPRFFMWAEGL
jgi:hypothetical protein